MAAARCPTWWDHDFALIAFESGEEGREWVQRSTRQCTRCKLVVRETERSELPGRHLGSHNNEEE